jgi:hypothetical protein
MKGPALALALVIAATSLPGAGHAADLTLAQAPAPGSTAPGPLPPLPPLPKLPQAAGEPSWIQRNNALAVGLGAIGGVVAFNVVTGGLATLPFMGAAATTTAAEAVAATESAVAVSRVYTVASAVVGALAMDWLVTRSRGTASARVPVAVSARVTPE